MSVGHAVCVITHRSCHVFDEMQSIAEFTAH